MIRQRTVFVTTSVLQFWDSCFKTKFVRRSNDTTHNYTFLYKDISLKVRTLCQEWYKTFAIYAYQKIFTLRRGNFIQKFLQEDKKKLKRYLKYKVIYLEASLNVFFISNSLWHNTHLSL